MGWEVLVPIILQYGLPLAESLYQKWSSGKPPTQADFDELNKLAQESPVDLAQQVIASKGLDANDPTVKAFLELVKAKG